MAQLLKKDMINNCFKKQILIGVVCVAIISCIALYSNSSMSSARIIETNLLTTVEVHEKGIIKATGVDTFGLTSNAGLTIKEVNLDTGKEIKSLAVSASQIVYSTVEGDVYEIGLKKTSKGCVQCNRPNKVKGLANIKKVVSGNLHFLAIDDEGNVYGWGSNIYGESDPNSDDDYIYYPTEIPSLRNASDIIAGYSTSGCIKNGNLFLFGEDNCDVFKSRGINKLSVDGVVQASIGRHHIILKNDSSLFGLGYSFNGELGEKKRHIDCAEIFQDESNGKIVDFYCGSYYSALLTKNQVKVFGGMKGTPLYSLKGHFEVERSSSYAFSNYDICDIYTSGSVNCSQEHNTKAYACAIVDSGVLYEQSNLTGVNYKNGSECIDKYSRANLHGEFVFEIIKNNCKIKNEDILILKSIDGESGNSIDILEALYFIKHNNVNYVNMSIAFNNRQLQYVLEGLISDDSVKYFV